MCSDYSSQTVMIEYKIQCMSVFSEGVVDLLSTESSYVVFKGCQQSHKHALYMFHWYSYPWYTMHETPTVMDSYVLIKVGIILPALSGCTKCF